MADLCLSCGEYVGQNAEDSPYCKCDRKKFKELKEIAEKYKLMMTPTAKDMEKALQIVERLKKRIEYLDEYIQDQYDNNNNIAGIEEDQLELLEKILEGEK